MQVASGRLRDSTHKFEVGQSVSLQPTLHNRDAASGAYKVTKQLPERDGEFEYQIKRTSVTAGTLFTDTHLPLRLWFEALWHVTSQKSGAKPVPTRGLLKRRQSRP
jgi:hypothetical protein